VEVAQRLTDLPPALADLTAGAAWRRNEVGESGGEVWQLDWREGDRAYLKVGTGRVADAIADEAARLRWLAGRVPVPAVRLFVATGERAWLLTDAVPGLTGDEWLARDAAALPAIVRDAAALLRRWHALPVEDCPFNAGHELRLAHARRNVVDGLVDTDDFDEDHEGWSAEAMLAATEALAPVDPDRAVTHGDFSLGNILFDAAGRVTGCIDVGRAGVADPYQDIAILWQNLAEFGAKWPAMLLRELGIAAPDERRLQFHRCLDELF
jgi:aminoglycoside 3'-phosphotransferase I